MKVYFETYGCTMNQGDTEIAMAIVEKKHEIAGLKECDVVVLNSCGVIGFTERKILRRVEYLKRLDKKIVMTGCLPVINFEAVQKSRTDAIVSLELLNEALDNLSKGRYVSLSSSDLQKSCVTKKRAPGTIAIVPISEGCMGNCTYCGTKFARGKLQSFPIASVVGEVEHCIANGYKEVQLTAQDTGCYGVDTGSNLPELLNKICKIPSDFRVRVGMMNPKYTLDILGDLLEAFDDEKIYKFIHVPVQSGDDTLLEHMKRGYTVKDFLKIVNAFRKKFRDISLSTDVIIGYPTEDEEAFLKTYRLIENLRPDVLNITRFSARPNTEASKLKDVVDRHKKQRSTKLTNLHQIMGLEKNRKHIGKKHEVLVTEKGKAGTFLARTNFYKQVALSKGTVGKFTTAKIKGATTSYLIGG